MYYWRKLTAEQRQEILQFRIRHSYPYHSPPFKFKSGIFHISAACFEHVHHIGLNPQRMKQFGVRLLDTLKSFNCNVFAWIVLPNHYHLLVETSDLKHLKLELGKLHGRTSLEWNLEENTLGRQVWYCCSDRSMRNERHYWATINYINNNAVHHGYVKRWQDWPFSSAEDYLNDIGKEKAMAIWQEYPILNYGKKWDDKHL